jgi:3-oxoacyl-[acyl-carrier protein] reductase
MVGDSVMSTSSKTRYAGKIALVTGASRGIGRAIAVRIASEGGYVVINFASRSDAAEETLALCQEAGGSGEILKFAVQDSEQVDSAVDQIIKQHSKIDILVNNAGISKDSLAIRTKNENWHSVLDVNLSGAFYCSRACGRHMLKKRYGRIVNISSVVAEMGNAGQIAYVSAKSGMIGMTRALAIEFASRGITVNSVTPGFIQTDMTDELSDNIKELMMSRIPLEKFGDADDVASAVAFLASDEAKYITGQVLPVNGGLHI